MQTNLLEIFENHLKNNALKAPSFHPYFEEALNYMLQAGGKHFRAQLLLGVVNSLKQDCLQDALDIALALEMMHTYSLIHDDLPAMDNADLRRSMPTTHVKYDEVSAILVGDALNTDAFYIISNSKLDDEKKIKCIKSLSKNAGSSGMVLGQALDCYFENKKLNLNELEFLHLHKTGALIASSFEMGAIISSLEEQKCKAIYDLGLKLGLVFQIQDDIIDLTLSNEEAGKPTHNDICKNSFTNLLGLEKSIEYKNNLICEIKSEVLSIDEKLFDMVNELINKYLKG